MLLRKTILPAGAVTLALSVALAGGELLPDAAESAGSGNSITTPAPGAAGYDNGLDPSLELDSAGFPVVSSYVGYTVPGPGTEAALMHCDDPNCAGAESGAFVEGSGAPNSFAYSLKLDSTGIPQISGGTWFSSFPSDEALFSCFSADCSGGAATTRWEWSPGSSLATTSLELDGSDHPVMSASGFGPRVIRCGDPDCSNNTRTLDTGGTVGTDTSAAVDASGNAVIAYHDATNGDLKVVHCNDPLCTGGDESIQASDTANVGLYASLQLDGSGFPVVSYHDIGNADLKVLHCNDANCDPAVNGPESVRTVDSTGNMGHYPSLALDSSGYPVVSYDDETLEDLKLLHCNDANCDPAVNGAESITAPDSAGNQGAYTSLELDASGFPVISEFDDDNNDLKLVHCNDVNCNPAVNGAESISTVDGTGGFDAGRYTSLELDGAGNPVIAHYDAANFDLELAVCNDANCAGGNEFKKTLDTTGDVGLRPSLQLAGTRPVVSYYDATNGNLKLIRCVVADCDDPPYAGFIVDALDTTGDVGNFSSLAMGAGSRPVVSYYDSTNGDLKVFGPPAVSMPDQSVATYTSIALDTAGYPVVSYNVDATDDLKVLHCNDVWCQGGNESIQTVDSAGIVGDHNSLKLDSMGRPVVSYYDATNGSLKLLHCNDPTCDPAVNGAESVTTPDASANDVGQYTSLGLDASGRPVVSYYDATDATLKVLHCNDANCAPGGDSIVTPDPTSNDVGTGTSLELDAAGSPVVAYHDATGGSLKVLHCSDANCTGGKPLVDTDLDGCTDDRELGTNAALGGLRDPNSFWDFMDQWTGNPFTRDKIVAVGDIGAVVNRFGASGDPSGDPLTPPVASTGYHTIADRNGSYPGQDPWDLQPPNGNVSVGDIGAVVAQFGHSCL